MTKIKNIIDDLLIATLLLPAMVMLCLFIKSIFAIEDIAKPKRIN